MTKKDFIGTNSVATILMVSPDTIRNWARDGKLKCYQTLGGHRRYRRAEIMKVAKAMR